jgi:hypothetical protein
MRILMALLAALLFAAAAPASVASPRVALVSRAPAVVAVSGFHGGSSVRVTLVAGALHASRSVRATSRGTARVGFSAQVDQCAATFVSAVSGTLRASAKTVPECGAQPGP